MSSNQGQGYGQYNPYGQSGNPYSDQGNPYANESYASRPQPGPPQGSSYYTNPEQGLEQQQGRYEMSTMNGSDPNRLLNKTRSIDGAIDDLEQHLGRMKSLQETQLYDTDGSKDSPINIEVRSFAQAINKKFQNLCQRVKELKEDPQSGNPRNAPQIGKVYRRLNDMHHKYRQQGLEHANRMKERLRRDFLIVNPDASDQEIREATESPVGTQIFSQAIINSDRSGAARTAASNVNDRHQEIILILRELEIVAELFQEMEAAVIRQEPAVTQIEQRGEEVTEHVAKANTELEGAVKKASAARRKKFYCLGIVVLIIIIIAVVVAVVVTVTKK